MKKKTTRMTRLQFAKTTILPLSDSNKLHGGVSGYLSCADPGPQQPVKSSPKDIVCNTAYGCLTVGGFR